VLRFPEINARLTAAGQRVEHKCGQADDEGSKEGGPEPRDLETRHELSDERQEHGVDYEGEETKCEYDEREGENEEERADEGVQHPKDQRGDEESWPTGLDSRNDLGSHHDRNCGD
jgi:hypothetical protein